MGNSGATRGAETKLVIAKNGSPLANMDVKSWEEGEDATITKRQLIGEDTAKPDKLHNGWEVSVTVEVLGSDLKELQDELIAANKNRTTPPTITARVTEEYRGGGESNWVYGGKVEIEWGKRGAGGREEYVEQQLTIHATDRQKIG